MTDWPFGKLKRGGYRVILADPPWRFRTYSSKGEAKSPQRHYATMTLAQIKALPVAELAKPDCVLVMWCTWPHLEQGFEVLRAWGFRYSTGGDWAKRSKLDRAWHMGPGYFLRGASEPFLYGVRGAPQSLVHDVRGLLVAPVREHSRKPDEMHARLQRQFRGPRCELFARETRPGWQAWGNQTRLFNERSTAGGGDRHSPAQERHRGAGQQSGDAGAHR